MSNIHLNGIDIYYERTGQGHPLILLHGLGSCGADWLFQIPTLSSYFEVITIDMRGHGKTEKKGPFTIAQSAHDVYALMKALKIQQASVVGLSYGSFVALKLAIDFPECVKNLVLVGTTSRCKDMGFWPVMLRRLGLFCSSMKWVAKIVAYTLFPDKNQKAIRKVCEARIASNDKAIYRALCLDTFQFDITKDLHMISCPTLLVVGEKDTILPLPHSQKIAEAVAHCTIVSVPGAHHAVPLDSPDCFTQILLTFL